MSESERIVDFQTVLTLGQSLNGSEESVLQQLVMAVDQICQPQIVQVFVVEGEQRKNLMVRAELDRKSDHVRIVSSRTDDQSAMHVLRTSERFVMKMKQAENAYMMSVYLPMIDQKRLIGVLRVVLPDEVVQGTNLLEQLTLLGVFGAVAIRTVRMNSYLEELQQDNARLQDEVDNNLDHVRSHIVSEFAAAVAHQLNNPLTTILADTELLLLDSDPNAKSQASLVAIVRAAKRAAEVVHRLMAVAQPNQFEGIPQPTRVTNTIDDVLKLMRNYLAVDHIQLHIDYADDLPLVWVIPDTLEDVWFNLLLNARDVLIDHKNPQIGIEVRPHPLREAVEVVIWDNGTGIPESEWSLIFEPFYTTKPKAERTGLGLYICKQIIEGMNGQIRVGHQEGGGTRFTVLLPIRKGG